MSNCSAFVEIIESAMLFLTTVISVLPFYALNTTFSASKPITNLNGVHISYTTTNNVIQLLITTKTLFRQIPTKMASPHLQQVIISCVIRISHAPNSKNISI